MSKASRSSTTAAPAVHTLIQAAPDRRTLGGMAGALLLLTAGAMRAARGETPDAAPMADAGLIRLAREHERLGRAYNDDFPEVDSDDHPLALAAEARRNRNAKQRGELLDQMMQTPPTTLAGMQALAAALVVEDLEALRPRSWHDDGDRLTALLLQGLLGTRGAA